MARVDLGSRARFVALGALVATWMLFPNDAEAQRRRRRRPRPPAATQPATATTAATTPATTPATGTDAADDGDDAAPASAATANTAATTATTTTTTPATTPAATTTPASSAVTAAETVSAPTPPPPRNAQPEEPPAADRPRPAALDLRAGTGMVGRSLWFTDDLFMRLRPYNLTIAPSVHAGLEWYPAAHFTRGAASAFGLVADGQFTLVFSSPDRQGRAYPTTAFNVNAGVRARLWLLDRIDVGLLLGYSLQSFTLDRDAVTLAPPEGIPNTTYHSIRAGITGRAQIVPRLAATAGSTFHYVISAGEITSQAFFPRALTLGVDFSLGVAVAITRGIEVRLAADWRRYFYTMNPMVGDMLVAGGAVDDHYGVTASIAFRR